MNACVLIVERRTFTGQLNDHARLVLFPGAFDDWALEMKTGVTCAILHMNGAGLVTNN